MRLDCQRQYEQQAPARVAAAHDGRLGAASGPDMLLEFGEPDVVLKRRAVGILFEPHPLRFNVVEIAMEREGEVRGQTARRGIMGERQGRARRNWEIVYLDR